MKYSPSTNFSDQEAIMMTPVAMELALVELTMHINEEGFLSRDPLQMESAVDEVKSAVGNWAQQVSYLSDLKAAKAAIAEARLLADVLVQRRGVSADSVKILLEKGSILEAGFKALEAVVEPNSIGGRPQPQSAAKFTQNQFR